MTLAFATHWPKNMPAHMAGKPTYFVEKIILGLDKHIGTVHTEPYLEKYQEKTGKPPVNIDGKLHTFREDKNDRWKAGKDIHFAINNRTKNYFQFAPVVPCISTQKVEINHFLGYSQVLIDNKLYGEIFHHGLDDIYQYTDDLEILAKNDGFDSVEDFFAWFNKDWSGKIIHWTNLKY